MVKATACVVIGVFWQVFSQAHGYVEIGRISKWRKCASVFATLQVLLGSIVSLEFGDFLRLGQFIV